MPTVVVLEADHVFELGCRNFEEQTIVDRPKAMDRAGRDVPGLTGSEAFDALLRALAEHELEPALLDEERLVLLFVVLAAIMYLTRNIDWYARDTREQGGEPDK